jgi:hypothetical protein
LYSLITITKSAKSKGTYTFFHVGGIVAIFCIILAREKLFKLTKHKNSLKKFVDEETRKTKTIEELLNGTDTEDITIKVKKYFNDETYNGTAHGLIHLNECQFDAYKKTHTLDDYIISVRNTQQDKLVFYLAVLGSLVGISVLLSIYKDRSS